jgi:ABC-type multidrug transport system fused ATPase/permease subunit
VEAEEIAKAPSFNMARSVTMAKDIHKLALEHADFFAPKPSMMELPAGLLAAGFAAIVIAVYDAVVNISPAQSNKGILIVVPLCFVVTYFYTKSRWEKHWAAEREELQRLQEEAGEIPEK